MSLLVIYKLLGLFVNPLTADDEYCLCNRENLLSQTIEIQLFKKQKNFFSIFCSISEIWIRF